MKTKLLRKVRENVRIYEDPKNMRFYIADRKGNCFKNLETQVEFLWIPNELIAYKVAKKTRRKVILEVAINYLGLCQYWKAEAKRKRIAEKKRKSLLKDVTPPWVKKVKKINYVVI